MKLDDLLAVSGLPGLYKLVSNRNNGLVVTDLDEEKSRFCSVRKHQFTPLETVAIYTYEDSTELSEVFKAIQASTVDIPVGGKVKPDEIKGYFRHILPDYDEDRVYVSDMKKVLKWYSILQERGLLVAVADEEE